MKKAVGVADIDPRWSPCLEVVERDDLAHFPRWQTAFANERKDHRYYELVEDTLHPEFDYRYFVVRDASGGVRSVQPFFLLDQDLLVGASERFGALINVIRRVWPRFMRMRTLMVGCVAGEGHLDGGREVARLLAPLIIDHARNLGAPLVVLKEFPARYRPVLDCFLDNGFGLIPSLPMTRLRIDYASFDDYMDRALTSATRKKLRKNFRAAEEAATLEMSIVDDVTPIIGEVY